MTAVEDIDTVGAKLIIDMCAAAQLLGVAVVISGITRALATTLTTLGIQLRVTTVRDVDAALTTIDDMRDARAIERGR